MLKARHRSGWQKWWQKIKTHLLATVLIALVIVLVALVNLGGYLFHWDWTGFNGSNKSGKTLWDWMQLLFIPVALAVAGFWFNHRERKAAELRAEAEGKISVDNQREAALKEYIYKMSELLLHENLRQSDSTSEVRKIARVLSLTVLPRLDGRRKRSVLQFLHESNLIERNKPVVELEGADLSGADLSHADWSHANLRRTNLQKADLWIADLNDVDLAHADLTEANLNAAFLMGSSLENASLRKTDLSGSVLLGANLNTAHLGGANLYGIDISGANLGGIQGITIEELKKKARPIRSTNIPDGVKHP